MIVIYKCIGVCSFGGRVQNQPDKNSINTAPDSSQGDFSSLENDADLIEDISEEFKKGYKLYNFRRPDKFSKEHLRALQDIHRDFVRQLALNLTAYLRMDVEMDIISVDQLTYDEFVCSMPTYFQNGIFKLNPLSGEIFLGLSSEILTAILDRMLGGDGSNHDYNRDLTQIEEALTKKIIEKIIKTLENSWSSVLPVKAEFTSLDNNYHVVPIATSGEIIALISFEIRLGNKNFGLINLCFPYPVLETVLQKLTPQYIFQHTNIVSNEIGRNEILHKIDSANIDVSVVLGTTKILINDVLELKEGDVIKLDQRIDEKLFLLVDRKRKFKALPGRKDGRICVKITDKYIPKE